VARYELHYNGQTYKLDPEAGELFERELVKFQQGWGPMLVDVTVARGHKMTVLLSPSIPVALLRDDNPKQTPTATFL